MEDIQTLETDSWTVAVFSPTRINKVCRLLNGEGISYYYPESLCYDDISTYSDMGACVVRSKKLLFINSPVSQEHYFRGHGIGVSYLNGMNGTLQIPQKTMELFSRIYQLSQGDIRLLYSGSVRRGIPVSVKCGRYEGVCGELERIKGAKYVVFRIEGLYDCVLSYIPMKDLSF